MKIQKKEEEIREEKNEDDDWKSETPPVVIALSVITCGLAWFMYKTCVDQ